MNDFYEQLWFQNTVVILGFLITAGLIVLGSKNERWQRAWRNLGRDRIGMISAGVIILYLVIGGLEAIQFKGHEDRPASLLGALLQRIPSEKGFSAPMARTTLSIANPEPLNGWHLLGTDALGKDTFTQTLRACRTALIIGGLTSAIYIPIGLFLGLLAGYHRRWVDDIIQYIYSVIIAVPTILLLVAIILVRGKGLSSMCIALATTSWIELCRLIRGETMRQTERPYIAAARALGQSHWKIMTRHIMPNVMHLVLINFVLGFSNLVIAEAILSYLGVGSPIGTPSWGAMIDGARGELGRSPVVWWNLTAATCALFFFVLSLNLLGDALRRAFDPKSSAKLQ